MLESTTCRRVVKVAGKAAHAAGRWRRAVGYLVSVALVSLVTLFALVPLHGGGCTRGRKNSQSLPQLYRLASQGWVCVSANDRLQPAVQHPDHLIDLK